MYKGGWTMFNLASEWWADLSDANTYYAAAQSLARLPGTPQNFMAHGSTFDESTILSKKKKEKNR
jgi:hypothetical protein